MYREPHDQTMNCHILLSVEVEPFVYSREHSLSEIFIVPIVIYFNLYLCAVL